MRTPGLRAGPVWGLSALPVPRSRLFPPPAVSAKEGDAYPLGALPVGTLICNLESHPGKGAQYIRAAGASAGTPAACPLLSPCWGGKLCFPGVGAAV